MKKLLITAIAFGLVAGGALAQNPNGFGNHNPCPGDKEYQFNIIATKNKNPNMGDNDGHRIFVDLSGKTKIYMTGDTDSTTGLTNGVLNCGNNFDVLDANGTDGTAILLVPCSKLTAANLNPSVCFDVYATPLGKPSPDGPQIGVECAFDTTCVGCALDGGTCATGNIDVDLDGHNGRPVTTNITGVFRASGCIDANPADLLACGLGSGDITFRNEWIFNIAQLLYYFWDYDPNGNRITQIRFCDVEGQLRPDGSPTCGPNTLTL